MKDLYPGMVDDLLPIPVHAVAAAKDFVLGRECVLICATKAKSLAAERLSSMVEEEWKLRWPVIERSTDTGFVLRLTQTGAADAASFPGTEDIDHLGDEGYLLDVDSGGVTIRAGTARGLLWGAMTLRQLIVLRGDGLVVRGIRIMDKPRYTLRGFQIDSGRAPNSLPKLKRIIRICSAFKLNFLLFREGDDEMNAVRYKSNKLGSSNPFALSMEELNELAGYAQNHGITLIPEVESLGHSTAKGMHYPELVSGGFKEIYQGIGSHIRKSHLAPCNSQTFDLLNTIYSEWFSVLQQPLIHLGLDEVRLPRELQAQHLKLLLPLVCQCAARHGVQASPIVWADAPATPDEYQDRVLRCLWEYGDGGAIDLVNEHLKKQGIEALSAPGCKERVLMAGGSGSGHKPYSKCAYHKAFINLAAWAQWGERRHNFIGLFAVQWSGNMTDDWLPDFLAAADVGWKPPERIPEPEALHARIHQHLARLSDADHPGPHEVDRPAWDGIWLKGDQWDEEIPTTESMRRG